MPLPWSRRVTRPTRAEPGSLRYQVHRDAADPTTLVFYELWRSAGDLARRGRHAGTTWPTRKKPSGS
ncbi:putative quinol monooxygenase [Nonomuraea sp. NPDC050783]|uniref:putative quinol monooxygenase n=1 Tax=Nonomuraea sp. NPDC050783 TaxID=3154634 RepID=UPI00346619F9